jgi:hypothetical protein
MALGNKSPAEYLSLESCYSQAKSKAAAEN